MVLEWSVGGVRRGWLVDDGTGVRRIEAGDADAPDAPTDVTVDVEPWAAEEIAAGRLTPQRALLLGGLRLSGDVAALEGLAARLAGTG